MSESLRAAGQGRATRATSSGTSCSLPDAQLSTTRDYTLASDVSLPAARGGACRRQKRGLSRRYVSLAKRKRWQEQTEDVNLNPRSQRWVPDNSYLQRHVSSAVAYNVWQYFQVTH